MIHFLWGRRLYIIFLHLFASRSAFGFQFLSETQVSFFNENGYLILREFSTASEMETLKKEMNRLIDDWDPDLDSVFSTQERDLTVDPDAEHQENKFLRSADRIEFFLDNTFIENGTITKPKHLALNKVGHALHSENQVFEEFTQDCRIAHVAQDLDRLIPTLTQTMYIFKQPDGGEKVPAHQDSVFLYTTPKQSCLGFWWAVDEATLENGCIWAIPGSHKNGIHYHWRRDEPDSQALRFHNTDTGEISDNLPDDFSELSDDYVPLPMNKGDLLLIHGAVFHASKPNYSKKERHSYQIHLIDGRTEWSPLNWMQYPEGKQFPTFTCLDKEEL